MSPRGLFCLALIVLAMLNARLASALTFKLDPHKEECFFEDVQSENVKIALQYQVSSGGFLDIDVNIYNPEGQVIHSVQRETEGRFTFNAEKTGTYKFCFSNMMSTLTLKTVSFNVMVGDTLDPTLARLENLDPIERSIMRLGEGLNAIQNEQKYLRMRERTHRNTSESTNSRVFWWSLFQIFALIAMSVFQVWYLRSYFESKRSI